MWLVALRLLSPCENYLTTILPRGENTLLLSSTSVWILGDRRHCNLPEAQGVNVVMLAFLAPCSGVFFCFLSNFLLVLNTCATSHTISQWDVTNKAFYPCLVPVCQTDSENQWEEHCWGARWCPAVPYRSLESYPTGPLSEVAPERKSLAFNRPLKYVPFQGWLLCQNFEPLFVFLIEYTVQDRSIQDRLGLA